MCFSKVLRTCSNFIFVRREYNIKTKIKLKFRPTADSSFQTITADAATVAVSFGKQHKKMSCDRVVEATITAEDAPLLISDVRQEFDIAPTPNI